MLTILKFTLQTVFFFLVFTVFGQLQLGQESLEHRYHRAVNSEKFQTFFWTTVRPVTWTWERVRDLAQDGRAKIAESSKAR